MDLKSYDKLKKEVDVRSFESKYKMLDKLLYISSFLGNFGSIFFAFFFIENLLYKATDEFYARATVITLATIISMVIFELLKRYVFKNMSLSLLHTSSSYIEKIYTVIFSIILIAGSFYLSLNGAKEFADKSVSIEAQAKLDVSLISDSIKTVYADKIKLKVNERESIIKTRNIYVNKMATGEGYSTRLREYNKLISDANAELEKVDNSISELENNRDMAILKLTNEVSESTKKKMDDVDGSKVAFLLISSFIELLILVGVFFHTFYKLNIYIEFKNLISSSQSYRMYEAYTSLLKILFKNGEVEVEEVLVDDETFARMAMARGSYDSEEISEFLSLCNSLGLIINYRNRRIAAKSFKEANSILLSYFNF